MCDSLRVTKHRELKAAVLSWQFLLCYLKELEGAPGLFRNLCIHLCSLLCSLLNCCIWQKARPDSGWEEDWMEWKLWLIPLSTHWANTEQNTHRRKVSQNYDDTNYHSWGRKFPESQDTLRKKGVSGEGAGAFADTLAGCTKQNLPGAVGKFSLVIARRVTNERRQAQSDHPWDPRETSHL